MSARDPFGDVLDRHGMRPGARAGFSPAVDVYYMADPPRAIVRAELAGVDPDQIRLDIKGRDLVIAGFRRSAVADEGRVYQQVEIEHGPFQRVVRLGADVRQDEARATYEDGVLRIELPLLRPQGRVYTVPVRSSP